MFSKLLGRCDTRCAVASPVMQDSMDSGVQFISNVKSLEKISENEIRQNPRIIHLQGLGELAMLVALLELLNGQRDHPVSKELLSDLPEIPIQNVNKLESDKKRCNICFEDYNNGDYVLVLPCLHIYHTNCIKEWFNSNNTCPLCKSEITESKVYGEGGRNATPGMIQFF